MYGREPEQEGMKLAGGCRPPMPSATDNPDAKLQAAMKGWSCLLEDYSQLVSRLRKIEERFVGVRVNDLLGESVKPASPHSFMAAFHCNIERLAHLNDELRGTINSIDVF